MRFTEVVAEIEELISKEGSGSNERQYGSLRTHAQDQLPSYQRWNL